MNRLSTISLLVLLGLGGATSTLAQTWSQSGPWTGGFSNLFWDPMDTTHIVAWGWHSNDAGANWSPSEKPVEIPNTPTCRFAFTQGDFDVLLLAVDNRLFRSIDSEDDWIEITHLFAEDAEVFDVASDPLASNRLYALVQTGLELQLHLSLNQGTTFELLHTFSGLYYNAHLRLCPTDPDRILLLGDGSPAYSADGGDSWVEEYFRSGEDGGPLWASDAWFNPLHPDTIYVRQDWLTFSSLIQTANGIHEEGVHWERGGVWALEVHPTTGTLYSTEATESIHHGNFRSDDGGWSWQRVGDFISIPFGWEDPAPDLFSFALHPVAADHLLLYNSDELYVSYDRGGTGEITGRGMGYSTIRDLAPYVSDSTRAITVTDLQQYWVPLGEEGWTMVKSRGVSNILPDPDTPDSFYLTGHYLFRATNAGTSLTQLTNWEFSPWLASPVPGSPGGLLLWGWPEASPSLLASEDYGTSWEPVAEQPDYRYPLFPDPFVPDRIWSCGGGVIVSDDGGQHWDQRDSTYPYFTEIVPEVGTGGVYAFVRPYPNVSFIYASSDLGETMSIANLPDDVVSIYDMARRPGTSRHLFIATEDGVFWTNDRTETWTRLDGPYGSFPTKLAFTPDGTGLHIGTESDGIWTGLDLFDLEAVGESTSELPARITLHPAWPNPFNASTRIAFDLPQSGRVRVTVFDLLGREIAVLTDGTRGAGHHELTWDARSAGGAGVASGAYLVRLEGDGTEQVHKIMLVK